MQFVDGPSESLDEPFEVSLPDRPALVHFPIQKLPKIAPSKSSLVTSPVISPSAR